MSIRTWLYGMSKKLGFIPVSSTDDGAIVVSGTSALYDNYYATSSTVSTGTWNKHDCKALIKRRCNAGLIVNDSLLYNILIKMNSESTYITLLPGETIGLDNANAAFFDISSNNTNVPYRIVIK